MKNNKVSLLKTKNPTIKSYGLNNSKNKLDSRSKIVSFSSYKRKRKYKKRPIFKNYKVSLKKGKKPYVIILYTVLLVLLSLLVVLKLLSFTTNSQVSSKNIVPSNFVSEKITLSDSEKETYTHIVNSFLTKQLELTVEDNVNITNLHKNGSFVYTNGYFSSDGENKKIYFDFILKKKKPYSLLINGKELINSK